MFVWTIIIYGECRSVCASCRLPPPPHLGRWYFPRQDVEVTGYKGLIMVLVVVEVRA